jgi:hypothetical protein
MYLLSLLFAQDAANLASDKWRVRESASHRLERNWPFSLPAVHFHTKAVGPDIERRLNIRPREEWVDNLGFEYLCWLAITMGKEVDDFDADYWSSHSLLFFAHMSSSSVGYDLYSKGIKNPNIVSYSAMRWLGLWGDRINDQDAKIQDLKLFRSLYRGWHIPEGSTELVKD